MYFTCLNLEVKDVNFRLYIFVKIKIRLDIDELNWRHVNYTDGTSLKLYKIRI